MSNELKFLLVYTDLQNSPNILTEEIIFNVGESDNFHEILSKKIESIQGLTSGVILNEENASKLLSDLRTFIQMHTQGNMFYTSGAREELEEYIYNKFNLHQYHLPEGLSTKNRKKDVVVARHLYYIILHVTNYGSLAKIGESLKISRNHATVLHAIKTINNLIDTKDACYFKLIKSIIDNYKIGYKFGI